MYQHKTSFVALFAFVLLTGCSDDASVPPQDVTNSLHVHEDEQQDISLASAVQELVSLRNVIRDGFAADDVDAAHGPLHDVGSVLEKLPELAKKQELGEDDLNSVNAATEALFDAFGAVDKTLHGGDGSTYEEEADKIDANVKIIADLAGVEDVGSATVASETTAEPADTVEPIDVVEPVDVAAPVPAPAP